MRISDWSSDVCSSDLRQNRSERIRRGRERRKRNALAAIDDQPQGGAGDLAERLACDEPRQEGWHTLQHTRPMLAKERGEGRSEEHTSELQSLMRISYAVFCLKKKKSTTQMNNMTH